MAVVFIDDDDNDQDDDDEYETLLFRGHIFTCFNVNVSLFFIVPVNGSNGQFTIDCCVVLLNEDDEERSLRFVVIVRDEDFEYDNDGSFILISCINSSICSAWLITFGSICTDIVVWCFGNDFALDIIYGFNWVSEYDIDISDGNFRSKQLETFDDSCPLFFVTVLRKLSTGFLLLLLLRDKNFRHPGFFCNDDGDVSFFFVDDDKVDDDGEDDDDDGGGDGNCDFSNKHWHNDIQEHFRFPVDDSSLL